MKQNYIMIEIALDRYNRTRPLDEAQKTVGKLAEQVNSKMGKTITNSSITSIKQTFRRIDKGEQDTVSIKLLIALSEILKVDYNTLIYYWTDNNKRNT